MWRGWTRPDEVPVISEKAHALLSRFAERAEHYEMSGSGGQER